MSGKPRLFLLDAGPVIALHELGLWREVLARAEVIVPAIVADKEVIFWDDGGGVGRPINLRGDEAAGVVRVCSTGADQLAGLLLRFDPVMRECIDAGEQEALALMCVWKGDLPAFCTADGLAAQAACLLGFADGLISLEELLQRIGLDRRDLQRKYSAKKMRQWVQRGRDKRLRGEGLAE